MTSLPKKPNPAAGRLKDALVAQVWEMSDAEVRSEAQAVGIDIDAAQNRVGTLRRRVLEQTQPIRQVLSLDGARARLIMRRVAKRGSADLMRMVADLRAPTDAAAIAAVQRLDALGLLSKQDLE